MITNSSLTIYHKVFDEVARLEKWEKHNYENVWFFGGKGAGINKGYDDANNVDVRIPYNQNTIDINKIKIGDIIVKGTLTQEINTQQDLLNYVTYNITSINDNKFGGNPHIRIGGK